MLKTFLLFLTIVVFSSANSFAQLEKSVKNGKIGFVDKLGNIVIKHKYDFAENYFNRWGLVEAKRDGKKYYIDKSGKEYLLAYNLDEITAETEAINLVYKDLYEIPLELFECKELKILLLRMNEFMELPPEIEKLTKLIILDVSENGLKEIPSEIGGLKELTYLDIFGNDIRHLPKEIGLLKKLEYLSAGSLDSVRLEELPTEIGQLTNLKRLYLRFTDFVDIPKEVENLTKLKELDLWMNGSLDFGSICDAFENFPNKVIISENVEDYFTDHPDTLVIFTPLIVPFKALRVKNLIELQTYNEGAYKFSKTEIDLLKKIEPNTKEEILARKKYLESKSLNWSNMRFTKVPEQVLMFNSLKTLDLSNNEIIELPDFSKLQSLETLNLKNNKLSLVVKSLKKLKHLQKLELRGNNISINEIKKLKKWLPDCEITN